MPIIKPRNKKNEADTAGKPKSDALAIAYATKKAASKGNRSQAMADSPAPMGSVADMIMGRRKKMADGGMVDDDNMETPAHTSPYDEDNMEAVLKELYDDSDDQIGPEPMDSEGGPDEDDHDESMISKIRRKMKK